MSSGPYFPTLIVLVGSVLYYYAIHYFDVDEVILATANGRIKGFNSSARGGKTYNSFRGIPYAQPPLGNLRFQPPVEFGKWGESILDGTKVPPLCPQVDLLWKKLVGVEDCLVLNVYTPKVIQDETVVKNKLLPVIVFFHGGHYMYGGSDIYGPQYFMEDTDVVLVTANYRLGVLGFLNAGSEARGNQGLKDQIQVLKWVKQAITDYGGNPELVTIMGESAGATSVNLHMISPMSEGLFHRAISQSGSSLCAWSVIENTSLQATRLGKKLDCPTDNRKNMIECLKKMDAMKIVETQLEILDPFHIPEAIYGPSVEFDDGSDDGTSIFLYEDPRRSAEDEQFARVPWMAGVTESEGCARTALFIENQEKLDEFFRKWNELAPNCFIYERDDIVSTQIKNYYFGKSKTNFTRNDYVTLTKIFSDRSFFSCVRDAAVFHAKNSPMYLYYLTYKSEMSFGHGLSAATGKYPVMLELFWYFFKNAFYRRVLNWDVPDFGVCHADDIQYLFSTIYLWDISEQSPHYQFSRTMIKLWTSFAKTGKPMKLDSGVTWTPVDSTSEPKYLNLSNTPEMIEEPFKAGVDFWHSLYV